MEYKEFKPIIIATIAMIAMIGALCIATPVMAEGNNTTTNDTNATVVPVPALEPTLLLSEVLIHISDKLGIAAERIFSIFVDAQVMVGLITFASMGVAIPCAYAAAIYTRRVLARDESSCEPNVVLFVSTLIGAFVFFIVFLVMEQSVGTAVLQITCPEYTAMKEMIGLLNP